VALDIEATGFGAFDYLGRAGLQAATPYPFWLSCWGAVESGGAQRTLFGYSSSASNTNLAMVIFDTSRKPSVLAQAGGSSGPIAGTAVAADTWVHILAVFRGAGDRELYVNGVSDGTSATNIGGLPTVDQIAVGVWWTLGLAIGAHDGKVAQCIIGRGDIGQADISMLAAKYTPHHLSRAIREGIVAYYPFRDPGIDRRDHSGNGHTLTLSAPNITFTADPPGMLYGLDVPDEVDEGTYAFRYARLAAYHHRKRRAG
jgi:hypothetical protein